MVDVLMVIYCPRLDELADCLASLRREADHVPGLRVMLWHNDGGPAVTAGLQALYDTAAAGGLAVELTPGDVGNPGFGPALNEMLKISKADYVLVLNQDAIPEPGSNAGERAWPRWDNRPDGTPT